MKALITIFLIALITTGKTHHVADKHLRDPTDTLKLIADIRNQYTAINANRSHYQILEKDLMDQSTEGGFAAIFMNGMALQKISAVYYGETGKATAQYYFDQDGLFFVLKQQYSYSKPAYMPGSKIVVIKADRYYLHKGALLRWLSDKTIQDPKSTSFTEEAHTVLADAETLRKSIIDCKGAQPAKPLYNDTLRCKEGTECASTGFVLKHSRDSCGHVIHVNPKNKHVPFER